MNSDPKQTGTIKRGDEFSSWMRYVASKKWKFLVSAGHCTDEEPVSMRLHGYEDRRASSPSELNLQFNCRLCDYRLCSYRLCMGSSFRKHNPDLTHSESVPFISDAWMASNDLASQSAVHSFVFYSLTAALLSDEGDSYNSSTAKWMTVVVSVVVVLLDFSGRWANLNKPPTRRSHEWHSRV